MSGGTVSKSMMSAVERELRADMGKTPKEIHEAIGMWSLISVRHALRQLCDEGRASFIGSHCRRAYYLTTGRNS